MTQEANVRTAFDVNYRGKLWSQQKARETIENYFPMINVLITPIRDAQNILGKTGDANTIAKALADEWGFDTVVITCGADGAVAHQDDESVEQPAFETETIEPVGTGDAFVGGFLACQLAETDLETSLEYGAAVAALKRTIPGDVALISREETDRVVEGEHTVISR
ncbi:PfkB family carbohydrate kinase [Haladaptatus pallidirubidus]|uniref:PfkB family carbohydrate kinase n=1 Tax=Haladaptatus pallidirubidus TaxID=1008152 RepID=UPI001D120320|nr:PfkB family carbohydrate kinase [Haladaptatus pallidirubidus]